MLLRPECKSKEYMTDFVSKFCETEEPMLDTFAGTFATAKAYLLLPGQCLFVECEKHFASFSMRFLRLCEYAQSTL